jgi:hypothetical protein
VYPDPGGQKASGSGGSGSGTLKNALFFLFHSVTSLGRKLVRVTPDRSSLLIKSRPPRLVCSECEDFDERPAVAIDLLDEVLFDMMRFSLVVDEI